MDQDKLINIQSQLKHNNDELQEFLRDLNSWETDIKAKDKKLKAIRAHNTNDKVS